MQPSKNQDDERIPFYDYETKKVIYIPKSALRPGMIRVHIEGTDEVVWAAPENLQPGDIKHGPFDEDTRAHIRYIHSTFSEQLTMSFEEWEEGFRRDGNPMREIALWSYAADVYRHFAESEGLSDRRRDIYKCIVACLTTGPQHARSVIEAPTLTEDEIGAILDRFFRPS